MAGRIDSADLGYMRSNLSEKSFKQNARYKLGDVRLKLNKAEDLCQVLMEDNSNLSEEVRILRGRFQDTQQCIDHFSTEKDEVCKDLQDLKTLLVQREKEFAAEKEKLESDKMSVTFTLERLRNEMRKLREENEDGKHRLAVMDEVLQSRNKDGENLQREKAAVVETMDRKTVVLEQQVARLQRDYDEAKVVTSDTEKQSGNFKAQIERAKGQLDATVKWNKTLTESKDRLRKEYQQVTESLSALKVEYDVYRTDTQQKMEDLGQRLVNKEKELVAVFRDKNRCETILEDNRKKLRVCEETRDKLAFDFQVNKEDGNKQRLEKEAEINKLIDFAKGKEKLLKQSDMLLTNKEQEIQKLKEQVDEIKDEVYRLVKDKNALKDKQERSEYLLREWSEKYENLEKEMREQEMHYEEQLSIIRNDLKEVQADCEQYARENKDLEETIAELTNENDDLNGNLKNLESNAAVLKRDIVDLHEKKIKFDEDLKILMAHKKSLEKEKDDVTNAKNILATENENLKVHQEEIMNEYDKQKKELELVIDIKNDIKKDLEATKMQLAETKAKKEEREIIFDKIRSEMSSDLEHHKAKLKQSKYEMDLTKKTFDQEKADLNMAKDAVTQENENLKIHQEEVMDEFEKMKKEFDILIVLKNDMRRDMERGKQELEETKRKQEKTERDAEDIKAEMEKECQTYNNLAQEATQEADKCQRQLDTEKKSLKKVVADLEDKLVKKDEALTELSGKCQVVEEELVKEKTAKVESQAPGSEWLDPAEEIGLFRPRDGSTPVMKTPIPEPPVATVTLGDEHKDIINKLQNRWGDVLDERKHIKEAMSNFYTLIDILISAKERLQNALATQREAFEKKLEEVSLNQSREFERKEYFGLESGNYAGFTRDEDEVKDPKVMEANVNELLRETNLYEGHIHYLKHQIGTHYSKAAKALDKHKSTMNSVMRMPNGQSLMSTPGSLRSSRMSSMTSLNSAHENEPNYLSEDGLKSLSDKHFQMINELTNLRKQLSEMKDEHSRLRMENKSLKDSDLPSHALMNGSFHGASNKYSGSVSSIPAAISSNLMATMPPTTSGYPARSSSRNDDVMRTSRGKRDTDTRYKAAVEALRNELRIS